MTIDKLTSDHADALKAANTGRAAQVEMRLDAIYRAEPERDDAVSMVLAAWSDLGTCRSIGMVVGPIPWTAIDAWATRHGLDQRSALLLAAVIIRLDADRAEADAAKRRIEDQIKNRQPRSRR